MSLNPSVTDHDAGRDCTADQSCPIWSLHGHRDSCPYADGSSFYDLFDQEWNGKDVSDDCTGDTQCPLWKENVGHTPTCPYADDYTWEDPAPKVTFLGGDPKETSSTTVVKWSGGSSSSWYRQCEHEQDEYVLTDGTTVYLSAYSDRTTARVEPDFAVYFCSSWVPRVPAYHLGWQDYGLPFLSKEAVLWIAYDVLERARNGETVELACMGAHGRTGSFVAILELLTQEVPDSRMAIARVRDLHCHNAVENTTQEWYVSAIAAHLRGEPEPARPVVKVWTKPDSASQKWIACTVATCKKEFHLLGCHDCKLCDQHKTHAGLTCKPAITAKPRKRKRGRRGGRRGNRQ